MRVLAVLMIGALAGCSPRATVAPETAVIPSAAGEDSRPAARCGVGLEWHDGDCRMLRPFALHVSLSKTGGCALMADRSVQCWDGDRPPGRPTPVAGLKGAVSLVSGERCAVLAGGSVVCWGGEGLRRSGEEFWSIPDLAGAVEVVSGDKFLCGRLHDGEVVCMEHPDKATRLYKSGDPRALWRVGGGATGLAAGNDVVCARRPRQDVICWSSQGRPPEARPFVLPDTTGAVAVAVNHKHVCAALESGPERCWRIPSSDEPLMESAPYGHLPREGVVSLGMNEWRGCSVARDGRVRCWGNGERGELGAGWIGHAGEWQQRAAPVSGLDDATEVAISPVQRGTLCAVRRSGGVVCWGDNVLGELGQGVSARLAVPAEVPGLEGATEVVAGLWFSCALVRDQVLCWGRGDESDEPSERRRAHVPEVVIAGGVTRLFAVRSQVCAALTQGEVRCWRGGIPPTPPGQTPPPFFQPTVVPALRGAIGLITGLVLLPSGQLRAVDPMAHLPGEPTRDLLPPTPSLPPRLGGVTQLASNDLLDCALQRSGEVSCWTYGKSGSSRAPEVTRVLSGAVRLALDGVHGCALRRAGEVDCWLLGEGALTRHPLPAAATELAAGGNAACAVYGAGQVECWHPGDAPGEPTYGVAALRAPGLRVRRLSVGEDHACAIRTDGRVVCWGSNALDQCGSEAHIPFTSVPLALPLE